MIGYEPIDMEKDAKYKITEPKYMDGHNINFGHSCSSEVTNLLDGKRVWTRVRFECGHMIKINCILLEKV